MATVPSENVSSLIENLLFGCGGTTMFVVMYLGQSPSSSRFYDHGLLGLGETIGRLVGIRHRNSEKNGQVTYPKVGVDLEQRAYGSSKRKPS